MPLCVKVSASGAPIGSVGRDDVASNGMVLVADPACSSGLQILTQTEIQANKSQLTMDTTSSPERVQDMEDLFYSFLLVLVIIWGLKQLLNLFTSDTSKD